MNGSFFSFFQAANAYLHEHPGQMLEIHFKEYETFQCSRCAQCCSLPWSVGVSENFYKRWEPIFKNHPDSRFHRAFVPVQAEDLSQYFAYLGKQADGMRCVLLDEDNLCLAQKHFGSEGKPESCRAYPHLSNPSGQELKVSHLMQSCRSAPQYLLQEPTLIYRMVPIPDPAAQESASFSRPAFSGLRFGRETLYLWLGLQMDTLWFESELRSPVQNLRALLPVFKRLLALRRRGHTRLNPAQLTQIYQQHRVQMQQTPPQHMLRKAGVVEWYLQALPRTRATEDIRSIYTQILAGQKLWPVLKVEEQNLLRTFLHNYLSRLLLSCHFWLKGRLNLIQQHLLFASLSCLLQLQTLAYRELTQSPLSVQMLSMALNLIEGQLLQSYVWTEEQGFHLQESESCLQQIETLLTLDLTVANPRSLPSQPQFRV